MMRNGVSPGFSSRCLTPAGMYVLCRGPSVIGGTGVTDARMAADVLLDEVGVAVVGWGSPPPGYLRFSSLHGSEDLQRLAEIGGGGKLVRP